MSIPVHVLIIEDSEADALLLVRELEDDGYAVDYLRVASVEQLIDSLHEDSFDIIITDYDFTGYNALDALRVLKNSNFDLPFIVVSGQIGESAAAEIIREGAHDFLMKDNIKKLGLVVKRELHEAEVRQQIRETQEDLLIAEQSFRNSLDNSPLGVRIVTVDGDLLYANQAILDIYGYDTVEELEITPVIDRYTPESYIEHVERERKRKEGERVKTSYEVNIIRKNGEIRHLLVSRKMVVWRGEVQYQVLYQDITERKQLEDLYMTIARNSPLGVYIVQDGVFKFINPMFLTITGYTEERLLDLPALDLVYPEDREETKSKAVAMLKGEIKNPYEFRIISSKGDIKWAMETVSSIYYKGKRATLGNFMDITERKHMEQKLTMTNHLVSMGEFVSGIAHELNNPLTAVIGFTDLLLAKDVGEDTREDLKIINHEAKRSAHVVESLLAFAKGYPEQRAEVNINDIIHAVLDMRKTQLKSGNIEVELHLSENIPLILADTYQLQQVFLNIIMNAEYFVNRIKEAGKLEISTTCTDDIIRVVFTDDGPGINPDDITHLFNPFFTTKEVGEGTGLGLSIAYKIINQHGGNIYARNEPGKGASFIIELPVKRNRPGIDLR